MNTHTNNIQSRSFIAAAVMVLALIGPFQQTTFGQNVAGGWTWEYESFGGRTASDSVTLAVEGEELSGEHRGFFGATKIENGKIDGNTISFSVSRSIGDRTMTSKYSGNVDGDKITGSVATEGFGDTRTIDWVAYRKPEIDPSGLWVWTSPGRGGDERKNWVKLNYDKSELSGLFLTERSQVPIQKAVLKGKAISFEIARRGRGGQRVTSFKGELSAKGIVGSITSRRQDEDRSIDWAASRETPDVDPVGTWAWEQRGRNGNKIEHKIVIAKNAEDALSGTYSRNDDSSELSDVKLDGDVVSFKMIRETGQGNFTTTCSAKINEDDLEGTMSGSRGERTWKLPFAAKRQLPKAEPAGSWSWTTRRFSRDGDGGEVKNTLALKSEDGKVSGTYTVGDASSDIKDAALDGNTLSFAIERQFGDRSATIRYQGVIRGDVIKGTSRFVRDDESDEGANLWANRWEAKRE